MSDGLIRYAAAACQTDFANPIDRAQMRVNTDRMLAMIDAAVGGSAPFLPVRLIVFPEFAHAAPVFATVAELAGKLAVPIPNEHTDRLAAKAREHDVYVQSGTMIEADPRWPGVVFNTTCLIGPGGILAKYRKVNPWIPFEVHASPHDVPGYDEPLFPVVDTPIGRLGCAICFILVMSGVEMVLNVFRPWAPPFLIAAISSLSFLTHFEDFTKGIFSLPALVFYASVIGFALFANKIILDQRKAA